MGPYGAGTACRVSGRAPLQGTALVVGKDAYVLDPSLERGPDGQALVLTRDHEVSLPHEAGVERREIVDPFRIAEEKLPEGDTLQPLVHQAKCRAALDVARA